MSGQHDRPETEQPESEVASENGVDGPANEDVEAAEGDAALIGVAGPSHGLHGHG